MRIQIIWLLLTGLEQRPIALFFGFSTVTVSGIAIGQLWAHLPGPCLRRSQKRRHREAARMACGEWQGNAKLTEDDDNLIVLLLADGVPRSRIAAQPERCLGARDLKCAR